MSFKKYKIKKIIDETSQEWVSQSFKIKYLNAKRKNYFSSIFLGIFSILVIWIFAFFTFSKLNNFSMDFSFLNLLKVTWLSSIDPTKEKINILITWVWWWDHEWTNLTDTIILASINIKKKTVTMLSIPRDLYVEYPTWWEWRINELYMKWLKSFSEKKAMIYLEEKVEQITWEKTDYFINIDFAGFIKFVDLLDWVDIDVPNDLVDTEYPDNNWWYETFSIKKWKQTLNWTTALKYARSRHSTNDFDRSLRQQLVIKAIKTKLLNLNYIWNPSKLQSLYYAISSNVKTDMWIKEILSFASLAKEIPNGNMFSFNLNNSCDWWIDACEIGWFLYLPNRDLFWWASVILPDDATASNISKYDSIQKFANIIFNMSDVFLEKYEINIVNTTKVSWLANKIAIMFKKYWFNIPTKDSIISTKERLPKSQVNFIWDEASKIWVNPTSKTLDAISQFIFAEQKQINKPNYSKSPWTKIEIILWEDYKLFLNN